MLGYTFFGRITEFFVGMALAVFMKKDNSNNPFKYFTLMGVIGIIITIYFLSILKIENSAGSTSLLGNLLNTLFLPLFGFAPLFYGLIKEKTWFSRMLSNATFVLLGKSSYVFYLIHIGVFVFLFQKITTNSFILFLMLNLTAVLLYHYLEKPLNDYFRNKI